MELAAGLDRCGKPLGQERGARIGERLSYKARASHPFLSGTGESRLTDDFLERETSIRVDREAQSLEVQSVGEGLVAGDFSRPLPGPCWLVAVSSVEGVMNDHLPFREKLQVGTTDAEVGDLFMLEPIVGRHDVEGLTHR